MSCLFFWRAPPSARRQRKAEKQIDTSFSSTATEAGSQSQRGAVGPTVTTTSPVGTPAAVLPAAAAATKAQQPGVVGGGAGRNGTAAGGQQQPAAGGTAAKAKNGKPQKGASVSVAQDGQPAAAPPTLAPPPSPATPQQQRGTTADGDISSPRASKLPAAPVTPSPNLSRPGAHMSRANLRAKERPPKKVALKVGSEYQEVRFTVVYSARPQGCSLHQANLIEELVLNGCDRAFVTEAVMRHGDNRQAAWHEVFQAVADGTCPPSLEATSGPPDHLADSEWRRRVDKRRGKLPMGCSGAPAAAVAGDGAEGAGLATGPPVKLPEAEDVLAAFEKCGSLKRSMVVLVLKIDNAVLRCRFEEQKKRRPQERHVRKLFHGTHVGCAEAIAQEGFDVRCTKCYSLNVWFARDSGYSHSYAMVPHQKAIPASGIKVKAPLPRIPNCYTMLYNSVLVLQKEADTFVIDANELALPEYIIFYTNAVP